ncbi:uncharacterized protein N7483_007109 [Penicillium malachiteum]|uniref:uncharacterized protein n=1 Tax=Penicillium malachiteum TaxID=1324776 RepID=UPI002548DD4B|nr:uncharacterized protein N7483_007109 [Penicillium malachiteum]KAJ5725752.1 hypothetical protein N7483_007109 [Penicillium malachiteum]
MNSLVATPPVPPHFYEHSRHSPSRISTIPIPKVFWAIDWFSNVISKIFEMLTLFVVSTPSSSYSNRKRKADDDGNDHDGRMSASPTSSPAFTPRQLPAFRNYKRSRPNVSGRPLALPRLLETLDTDALRMVVRTMCERHPQLADEVAQTSPHPSSFPLGGNTESDYAYNRVRQPLTNLLEALSDFTPNFLPPNEPQPSVSLSYLDGATDIIHALPRWSTPQNNIERDSAYDEICKAWVLVIREAAKRGGGIQLQYGGWDQKLAKHNQASGGKLQGAVNELGSSLGWMGGPDSPSHGPSGNDLGSIRDQLLSGTYGLGTPVKVGPW